MPNTKTGTNWAPDIRPESIETFTETYTPEGGEEQTVTYKRVADHPFLNDIRDKLAFFATHAGAVWYNLAERKTLLAKLQEQDEVIEGLNAKIDIAQSDFMIFSGDSGIEMKIFSAISRGHVVDVYMRIKITTALSGTKKIFTVKSPYKPVVTSVLSVRNINAPYGEKTTLWIPTNGEATLYAYPSLEANSEFYIQGNIVF